MENTMHLMLGFDACCEWQSSCQTSSLACSIAQEGISFAKDHLGSGSSSFKALPQRHHPGSTTDQLTKQSARLSLVHVIVTYIWRAQVCAMKGRCMY